MQNQLISNLFRRYGQFLKFLIAGAFVVAVNLTVLYVLTDLLHIYYILSTVLAFFVAFSISFFVQKHWTFKDRSNDQLHIQLPIYLAVQLVNLTCNTALMFVFVEYLHVWYLMSQAIISFLLAMVVYFINKAFIFKPTENKIV